MRLSIRYQLLVPLLTLLVGVAGLSTWAAFASAGRARQQVEKQMQEVARTLNESAFPLEPSVLEQMKGLSGAEYLVIDARGRRTATLPADAIQPPADAIVPEGQTLRLGPRVSVAGVTYFCSGVRLLHRQEGKTLYILYPEARWRDALWEAVWPSLLLGGFVGLASVAWAVGVGQRLSKRIRELERRTRLIAAGDFSPMPLPGRDDELRDLGRSVNEMAQRLAQLQETVQKTERLRLLGQVSGGLAHQLRNGVAGARLAVQLHARACAAALHQANGTAGPDGKAPDGEALEVALRQLALMETNLKRFLDLGRTGDRRLEPCSLTALVDETVALLGPRCRHTHIDLRWQPPAAAFTLAGDRGQLGQLLVNVLNNGIEAVGSGGWVEITLAQAEAGRCVLEVADSGPGPAPAVAERLFEPFVTGKPEGVGLGLAVARQVAEAHGGRIDWRRQPDRTCFRIELPVEQGP